MMQRQDEEQQSRALKELTSLILNILPSASPAMASSSSRQITPAGLASMMLGISLSLMLCGSLTFFLGFMLLPWVIGFIMVFYFVGLVSSLSVLGRMFLCYATTSPSSTPSPHKNIPAWKLM